VRKRRKQELPRDNMPGAVIELSSSPLFRISTASNKFDVESVSASSLGDQLDKQPSPASFKTLIFKCDH
jgi:hypothetical protein